MAIWEHERKQFSFLQQNTIFLHVHRRERETRGIGKRVEFNGHIKISFEIKKNLPIHFPLHKEDAESMI